MRKPKLRKNLPGIRCFVDAQQVDYSSASYAFAVASCIEPLLSLAVLPLSLCMIALSARSKQNISGFWYNMVFVLLLLN